MLGTADINGQVSFNNLYGGSSSANGISINASLGFANPGLGVANTLYVKSNKVTRSTGRHPPGRRHFQQHAGDEPRREQRDGRNPRDGQSSNNTIQDNHMRGDHPDCYDDTHGMGTSGPRTSGFATSGSRSSLQASASTGTSNAPGSCGSPKPA